MNQKLSPPDFWNERELEAILRKELAEFSRWYRLSMVETFREREQARESREPKEKIILYNQRIDGLLGLHQRYFHQQDYRPEEREL